jgi:hypothetical protein
MLDQIRFGASEVAGSTAFYDRALDSSRVRGLFDGPKTRSGRAGSKADGEEPTRANLDIPRDAGAG